MELNRIYNEDCLEGMKRIPDGSVDCIICDLPYGTTSCSWDTIIPFDKLWEQYNRIAKDTAPIVLFGSEPFSTYLRLSNIGNYRYDWIWDKKFGANFVQAKRQPLKTHEIISVFSKAKHIYNPQMIKRDAPIKKGANKIKNGEAIKFKRSPNYDNKMYYYKYPDSQLHYSVREGKSIHPTQKPVELIRYLVRTYSNPDDTILDNCMGSGTTAVACVLEKRNFIGFELNKEYYDKANARLKELTGPFKLYGNIGG